MRTLGGTHRSAERCRNEQDKCYDRLQFCFDVFDPEQTLVARSTITWHYTRDTL